MIEILEDTLNDQNINDGIIHPMDLILLNKAKTVKRIVESGSDDASIIKLVVQEKKEHVVDKE